MKNLLFIIALFISSFVSAQATRQAVKSNISFKDNRLQYFNGTSWIPLADSSSVGSPYSPTTVGANFVTLSNPSAITFPRINADNSISALSASAMLTALGGVNGNLSTSDLTQAGTARVYNIGYGGGTRQLAFGNTSISEKVGLLLTNSSTTVSGVFALTASDSIAPSSTRFVTVNGHAHSGYVDIANQIGGVGITSYHYKDSFVVRYLNDGVRNAYQLGKDSFLVKNLRGAVGTKAIRYSPSTGEFTYADTTIAGGGGGTPGGSTTQVQYNNAGSFAGITGATTNGTTLSVTAPLYIGQASPAYAVGKLTYDTDNESLTFFNNDNAIGLQVGQEEWIRVKNVSGSTIANGASVYISGANSGYPTIALAQSNSSTTTIGIGLTTESIANNAIGYVTVMGVVHGLNTAGFTAGLPVFIDPSTPGALTQTTPSAPNYRYRVGIVAVSDATVGTIHVTPSTASLGNGTANQLFGMNTAGTAQEVKSILGTTGNIGITNATNSITINSGPLLARQDANKVLGVVNIDSAYTTTATAAGTTTLTAASTHDQYFTGSTTQIVVLPAANTFIAGREYYIVNKSSGVVTVNYNGGSLAQTIAANTFAYFKATDVSTSTGVWDVQYSLIPISTGISGLGTGVATALGVSTGSAGAFVLFNGAGGTPSSLTLTSATGLPISTGVSGLGTNVATFLATASSANFFAAISDETGGTGVVMGNISPAVTTSITTASTTFALINTTATTFNLGGAATTLNLAITSTATLTHNYSTGATANAATKTINLGTAGVSGSITNINIGSVVSGSTGTTTVGNLLKWTTFSINIPTTSAPTTGGTVAAATTQWNVINPAGTLATLVITLPASPVDGQECDYSFTQIITSLTFSGGTLNAPITSAAADSFIRLGYVNSLTKWVRK